MSLEEGRNIYTLEHKDYCKYMINGETKTAISIDLHEPGMSHMNGYTTIKQTINGLLMDMQLLAQDQEIDPAGEQLRKTHEVDQDNYEEETKHLSNMVLFAFGKSDKKLSHFVDDFKKMVINSKGKSLCTVDGVQPMTEAIWNTMHPEDGVNLAIRWAVFFTMPSDFLGKKESEGQSGLALPAMEL